MKLAFACLQRRFGALALGDFFRRDVDADDFACRIA